jgi:hypothetical protein
MWNLFGWDAEIPRRAEGHYPLMSFDFPLGNKEFSNLCKGSYISSMLFQAQKHNQNFYKISQLA